MISRQDLVQKVINNANLVDTLSTTKNGNKMDVVDYHGVTKNLISFSIKEPAATLPSMLVWPPTLSDVSGELYRMHR